VSSGSSGRRDLDLRRWKHAQELRGQPTARLPKLQTHYVPCHRIEFPQPRIRLFAHSRARVIALEPNPRDIRIGVVVPFNPHNHRLAPTPDRDNTGGQWVIAVWVLVDNHDAPSHDFPARLAGITTPLPVPTEYSGLYIGASEP
jgi:hypothetical protein